LILTLVKQNQCVVKRIVLYINELKLKPYDAEVITAQKELASYFEEIIAQNVEPKNAVTWLTSELLGRLNKASLDIANSPVEAKTLATLISRIDDGTISGKSAKDVLDYLMENENQNVDAIIEELGLKQVSDDGAILAIIDEIIANNEDKVEEYKSGKDKLFGFFVGQVMKASKGSANPQKVNQLLKQRLS